MKIAIDFDDTIVCTKEKIQDYLNRFNVIIKDEEEETEFYKKYMDDITKELTLKKSVKTILNKLAKNHELYIITARSDYYSNNVKPLVLEYIKKNKLPIKEVFFECIKQGKADKCVELGIDLFIDDSSENCLFVQECKIDTLLFGYQFDGLKSVNNWKAVLKYVEEKERWMNE